MSVLGLAALSAAYVTRVVSCFDGSSLMVITAGRRLIVANYGWPRLYGVLDLMFLHY